MKSNSLKVVIALVGGFLVLAVISYVYSAMLKDEALEKNEEVSQTPEYDTGVDSSMGGATAEDSEGSEYWRDGGATTEDEQKLIKSGAVEITIDDLDEGIDDIRKFAKEVGGFVTDLSDSGKDQERVAYITIKVPNASFDSVMKKVKDLGVDIESVREDTSDVTQAYMDLEARLENQKAYEDQLVSILERATKVTDVLEVEKELSVVRSTIEQLEASIRYYDSQIDMSTITVTLSLNPESYDVKGDVWRPVGIVKEAGTALVELLKGLGTLVIWIAVFSPVVLIPYFIVKLIKKRQ